MTQLEQIEKPLAQGPSSTWFVQYTSSLNRMLEFSASCTLTPSPCLYVVVLSSRHLASSPLHFVVGMSAYRRFSHCFERNPPSQTHYVACSSSISRVFLAPPIPLMAILQLLREQLPERVFLRVVEFRPAHVFGQLSIPALRNPFVHLTNSAVKCRAS